MPYTILHFFEKEDDAVAKFSEYRHTPVPALMIGPTSLLTSAGTKIEALGVDKEYFVVVASNAGAMAAPAILSPP